MWLVFDSILLLGLCALCFGGELTFELPDNEKQCFHELLDKGVKCTIEFQVDIPYLYYFIICALK